MFRLVRLLKRGGPTDGPKSARPLVPVRHNSRGIAGLVARRRGMMLGLIARNYATEGAAAEPPADSHAEGNEVDAHREGGIPREEVTNRVLEVVKSFNKVDPEAVTPSAHFIKDLGLDSLDAVELVLSIEDEFAIVIPDAESDNILSVQDAIDYIASHPHAK